MKENTNKYAVKNTLGMFDLLKGFFMILMIVAHTPGYFDNIDFIPKYIFGAILGLFGEAAMPGLMVIVGYSFRKTTFKKCVVKQYRTLIIPYIITSAITIILSFVFWYLASGFQFMATAEQTKKVVEALVFGAGKGFNIGRHMIPPCGPCWFLLALVIGSIIFNTLLNYFKDRKLFIAALIVSIVGWIMGLFLTWPWSISQGFITVIYIALGYFAKKKKLFTSGENINKKKIITIVSVFIFFVGKSLGGEYNMAYGTYTFGPIAIWYVGFISCLVIFWFLRLNNRKNSKFLNSIRFLGRNSLYVLCIHSIEIVAVGNKVQEAFLASWTRPVWMRNCIIISVRMLIDLGITYIFVKIKNRNIQRSIIGTDK